MDGRRDGVPVPAIGDSSALTPASALASRSASALFLSMTATCGSSSGAMVMTAAIVAASATAASATRKIKQNLRFSGVLGMHLSSQASER